MKILIMTNTDNEEIMEDIWIANSFSNDGHDVCIVNIDYIEELDTIYDVFIRRNTWYSDETKLQDYHIKTQNMKKRLLSKNLPRINFEGLFDATDKRYLVKLFKEGYPVIPSIDNLKEIEKLPIADQYLLKPLESYDGIGQIKCKKDYLKSRFTNDYIIQPVISFMSEIQFYFINNVFQYALEFSPSKVPIYPKATMYDYNKEELNIAQEFANLNKELVGIQRIDFLKLHNGQILLLEIEDAAPYLDLDCVDLETREIFLKNYKKMVYNYMDGLDSRQSTVK